MTEEVVVESAVELTSEELKKIKKVVEDFVGNKVELKVKIDSELIGGLKLTVRSLVLDISLKETLNQAEESLAFC